MITAAPTPDGGTLLALQNSERHRQLLAASSEVYGSAKQILGVQMLLTVGGAIVVTFISTHWPGAKSWTVAYAVAVSLLDAFVLERWQARYRKLGAQIQEIFDGELFGLEWNSFAAGSSPPVEEWLDHGRTFLAKNPDASHLRDWYPAEIATLPLPYATLVCQRTNCWWDERLRRRYLAGLIGGLVFLTLGLGTYGLARELTLPQFFLVVLAPLWPALIWGIREAFKQHDAAESAGKLRIQVEQLWTRCLQEPPDNAVLALQLRTLQTEIFRGRGNRPLIFNWVNTLLRSRHQTLMHDGAAELAKRLRAARPDQ
jgi:hypothetical protein